MTEATNLRYTRAKGPSGYDIGHGATGANTGLVVDDLDSPIAAVPPQGSRHASGVGRSLQFANGIPECWLHIAGVAGTGALARFTQIAGIG